MPTLSLSSRIESALAAQPDQPIAAIQGSVMDHVLADLDPRKLIDTPAERAAIEAEAVIGFERYVKPAIISKLGDLVGLTAVVFIEAQLTKLLDIVFVSLAATLPPSPAVTVDPPAPVAPHPPIGSSGP